MSIVEYRLRNCIIFWSCTVFELTIAKKYEKVIPIIIGKFIPVN